MKSLEQMSDTMTQGNFFLKVCSRCCGETRGLKDGSGELSEEVTVIIQVRHKNEWTGVIMVKVMRRD